MGICGVSFGVFIKKLKQQCHHVTYRNGTILHYNIIEY